MYLNIHIPEAKTKEEKNIHTENPPRPHTNFRCLIRKINQQEILPPFKWGNPKFPKNKKNKKTDKYE